MSKTYYKIVDMDSDGQLKALFHGVNRSKILARDVWLEAEIKPVSDGPNGTVYFSGWHIMPSAEECIEYLTKFKQVENKVIVSCEAEELWPKEHSPSNVFLARRIKILDIVT